MPKLDQPGPKYFLVEFPIEKFLQTDQGSSAGEKKIQIVQSGIPTSLAIVRQAKTKIKSDFFEYLADHDRKICETEAELKGLGLSDIKTLQLKLTSADDKTSGTFEEIKTKQQEKLFLDTIPYPSWPIDLKLAEKHDYQQRSPDITRGIVFGALSRSLTENPHFIFMKGEKDKQISLFEEISIEVTEDVLEKIFPTKIYFLSANTFNTSPVYDKTKTIRDFRDYFKSNNGKITFCFERKTGKEVREGPASKHYRPFLEKSFGNKAKKIASGWFTRAAASIGNLLLQIAGSRKQTSDQSGKVQDFYPKVASKKVLVEADTKFSTEVPDQQSRGLGLHGYQIEMLQTHLQELEKFLQTELWDPFLKTKKNLGPHSGFAGISKESDLDDAQKREYELFKRQRRVELPNIIQFENEIVVFKVKIQELVSGQASLSQQVGHDVLYSLSDCHLPTYVSSSYTIPSNMPSSFVPVFAAGVFPEKSHGGAVVDQSHLSLSPILAATTSSSPAVRISNISVVYTTSSPDVVQSFPQVLRRPPQAPLLFSVQPPPQSFVHSSSLLRVPAPPHPHPRTIHSDVNNSGPPRLLIKNKNSEEIGHC